MTRNVEASSLDRVVARVVRRIVPFMLLMYVLAFLDRANIGFAKSAFQVDTGVSDAAFAFGAGIFFIGYALLEVPSNLIMHRVGARVWMCRIMVTWGLVSAATMFASGETSFYVLRFLLGVAEAGFFPGIIYFLTQWIPASHRGRVLGLFYFGAPLALVFGSPLSGLLLEFHGLAGLQGWQWMFLIEGLLATIVGVWAFWYLDDAPLDARWLSSEDRTRLAEVMRQEDDHKRRHGPASVLRALGDRRVLFFSLVYALIQMSVYGVVFYLPTQVAALMGRKVGLEVGLVSAIPWCCALIASYWIPKIADRSGRYGLLAALTTAAAAAGIALSVWSTAPGVALVALSVAAAGFIAVQPLFWSFPTAYLGGAAAASGLALINSLGSLGAFVAPNVKVFAEQAFQSHSAGLYTLAATTLIGALLFLALPRTDRHATVSVETPLARQH